MAGCATENGGTSINGDSSIYSFRGNASWYQYGTRTASGEKFDTNNGMTIAHKTLPFGTKVKLTNLENNKTVIATVNGNLPNPQTNTFYTIGF